MIEMTFDEYDAILDKVKNAGSDILENPLFPKTEEDAENLLDTKDGATLVIITAEKTDDAELKKALNSLLRTHLTLLDDSEEDDEEAEEDETLTSEYISPRVYSKLSEKERNRFDKVRDRHKRVKFHLPMFCPSMLELDMLVKKHNIAEDDTSLAFLMWVCDLSKSSDEDEDKLVKKVSKYAKELINKNIRRN